MTAPAAAEPTGDAAVVSEDPTAATSAAVDAGTATPPPAAEPVTYSLTLPDGSPLDPKAVERVTEFAKANQLPPDIAQQVLAQMHGEVEEVTKVLDAANKPGGTMYEARVKTWEADALAAYDLGNGNPERLKSIVVEAQLELQKAPPAIREFLVNSGYGSHPDAIRWLRDVHARTKEKPIVMGDKGEPPPKPKSMAQRMYETEAPASTT
jgi:hypothetical protein